jgi:ribonuclease D
MRIKEARSLSGRAAGVARTVAAWRERRAADTDQPVRFVLPDLALVGIAQRPPTSLDELRGVRGLDGRFLRGGAGELLLAAIREGVNAPPPPKSEVRDPMLDRDLRPAVTLVSAWIAQLARDLDLDTALLATRSDIEALLGNVPGARLAEGWRAEIVGEPVRRLVQGDAALAFDRKGGLVLEDRVGHGPT